MKYFLFIRLAIWPSHKQAEITVRDQIEQFGPAYTIGSSTLTKFRRLARNGLSELTREQVVTYGIAVETAVLAAQRSQSIRNVAPPPAPYRKGDGSEVERATLAAQKRALMSCGDVIRRARTPRQWWKMYEAAMIEKTGVKRWHDIDMAKAAFGDSLAKVVLELNVA